MKTASEPVPVPVAFAPLEENWNYYLVRDKATGKKLVLAVKFIVKKIHQGFDQNGKPIRDSQGNPVFRFEWQIVPMIMTIEEYNEMVEARGLKP